MRAPTSERLRKVLDAVEEGVAILGADGVVEYVNESAERVLGVPAGELVGWKLLDFRWGIVDLEGRPLPREALPPLRVLETGRPEGPVVVGMTSPAVPELAWVEASARPLLEDGGGGRGTVSIFRDVSARVRAEQGLVRSERLFQALAESVPVGIFHTDAQGACVWVNQAMTGIDGQSREESLGTGWTRTLHPEDREEVLEALRAALEAGVPYELEHRHVRSDGQVRWVLARATQVKDARGKFLGWVGSVTDVTEAKAATLLKDQIIGHVSHELRAPLVSIRGALAFLEPHVYRAGEEPKRFHDMAWRNTALLERLVRDLLDMERLQTGHLGMALEPLAVDDVLREAREVVLTQATELGVTLREPAPTAVRVTADRDRLTQVLTNLLSNAAKFSEPGGEVWMDVATASDAVTLGVHDRGRGIAAEDHQRIFEPFAQAEGRRSARLGGVGLGLAISRAIVDRHGGRIWVESALGEGASFYVSLPAS